MMLCTCRYSIFYLEYTKWEIGNRNSYPFLFSLAHIGERRKGYVIEFLFDILQNRNRKKKIVHCLPFSHIFMSNRNAVTLTCFPFHTCKIIAINDSILPDSRLQETVNEIQGC